MNQHLIALSLCGCLLSLPTFAQEKAAKKAAEAKSAPPATFGSKEAQALFGGAEALFRRAQDIHDLKTGGDEKSAFLAAIVALKEFEKQFPAEEKAAQAAYWVGTSHMLLGEAAPALLVYQKVYDKYPAFKDRDQALFRIGICNGLLGDGAKARAAYAQVIRDFGRTKPEAIRKAQKYIQEVDLAGKPAPKVFAERWMNGIGGDEGLKTFQGDVVVVTFFATWCPNCRKEWPRFRKMVADFSKNGVTFLAVVNPEDLQDGEPVDQYLASQKLEFLDVALDPQEQSGIAWRVSGYPASAVIDRKGIVRWRGHPAFLTPVLLEQVLAER